MWPCFANCMIESLIVVLLLTPSGLLNKKKWPVFVLGMSFAFCLKNERWLYWEYLLGTLRTLNKSAPCYRR